MKHSLPAVGLAAITVACGSNEGKAVTPQGIAPSHPSEEAGMSAFFNDSGNDATESDTNTADVTASDVYGNPADVPHVVRGCPPSDAGTVGSWQNVSPPIKLDKANWYVAAVVDFAFDPQDTSTIYQGSNSEGLYKTTDCGATWVHIDTGRNGSQIDMGRQWTIAVDPVDPNVIYTNSGYGAPGLWKSTNGGVDWDQLFPAGSEFAQSVPSTFVEAVAIDPTNHQHLVVSSHNACTGAYAGPVCLAESIDGGATWKMMKGGANWGYEGGAQIILDTKTWLWIRTFDGIWRTADQGMTWTQVYKGYATNQNGELYQTSNGTYFVAGQGGVVSSTDTVNWQLLPNSPGNSNAVTGDGNTIYVDVGSFGANWTQPGTYLRASQNSPTNWTTLPAPGVEPGWVMRYDRDHHILYSSNGSSGLWAIVIQ